MYLDTSNASGLQGIGIGPLAPSFAPRAPEQELAAGQAQPVQLAAAAAPERASASNEELRAHALLAQDVYNDSARPPAGYSVASAEDLKALNLDPSLLQTGDFRARVYVKGSGENAEYVIAFRGTQSGADWRSNLEQGVGLDSTHYRAALAIGERIGRSELADHVSFTGHSLGGGLASAAAIASGRPADTFNAAGLSDHTIDQANGIRQQNGIASQAQVDAWYVRGEILSAIQDGGDRAIGGILGGLLGGGIGGIAGGALADAPPAYGDRHALDAVAPEGKSWLDRHNPVDKHGMDWVLSSLPH